MDAIRTERFDMALSKKEKEFMTEAAALLGLTLSQFVRSTVLKASKEIQTAHNELISSQKDRVKFKKMILNPPEPNEELVKLLLGDEYSTAEKKSYKGAV